MMAINQQRWKTVEYSRSKIIKSGKIIKNPNATAEQIEEATKVIDNWRAAHAFPLHVIYMHLRRMADGKNIVVAERLKRLDSIINKLEREPSMSLWMMQDLGGCRFIVPTLSEVFEYAEIYDKSSKRHLFKEKYDYINSPKASGYRSLHMVYEYHSDKIDTYNKNMLIEIQYRTHLQHLWATAVETVGLFTKQAIKAGQGSDDVKRFFVLISSLFALREGCPVIPGTAENEIELVSEIEEVDSRCHFLDMLSAIRVAIDNEAQRSFKKQGYYILILNYDTKRLRIRHFMPSQIEQANELYSTIESQRDKTHVDAVLVRVSSFQTLKTAYPNYFTDIGEFLTLVKAYLS